MSKKEMFSTFMPAKSISNVHHRATRQNATERNDVRLVAFLRENLNSSAKYAVSTSWNEIVEVNAASTISRKKPADHSDAKGISLKISGSVMKMSDAPSVGSRPALKTAGKNTRPASVATSRVSNETLIEVLVRLLSFLKYDAYVTIQPIPTESEKNA